MSIEAHSLYKKFGAYTALDGVDLNVPQGKLWRCSARPAPARRRC